MPNCEIQISIKTNIFKTTVLRGPRDHTNDMMENIKNVNEKIWHPSSNPVIVLFVKNPDFSSCRNLYLNLTLVFHQAQICHQNVFAHQLKYVPQLPHNELIDKLLGVNIVYFPVDFASLYRKTRYLPYFVDRNINYLLI